MGAVLIAIIVFMFVNAPNNNKSIETVGQEVVKYLAEDSTMEEKGQSELKRYYGISRDDVEGFVLYGPTNSADVSEMLIVKALDQKDVDSLRKAVERRRNTRLETFAESGGTQVDTLNKAQIKVRGKFVFYCVGSQANRLSEAFTKSIKN